MTTSEFADYELHVEFKAPATTNSGVFLRTPLEPKDPTKDCYRGQHRPGDNPFPTASLVGRRISTSPRTSTRSRSTGDRARWRRTSEIDAWDGQWHTFDITVQWRHATIALDGKTVRHRVDDSCRPTDPSRPHRPAIPRRPRRLPQHPPEAARPETDASTAKTSPAGTPTAPTRASSPSRRSGEIAVKNGPGQLETERLLRRLRHAARLQGRTATASTPASSSAASPATC